MDKYKSNVERVSKFFGICFLEATYKTKQHNHRYYSYDNDSTGFTCCGYLGTYNDIYKMICLSSNYFVMFKSYNIISIMPEYLVKACGYFRILLSGSMQTTTVFRYSNKKNVYKQINELEGEEKLGSYMIVLEDTIAGVIGDHILTIPKIIDELITSCEKVIDNNPLVTYLGIGSYYRGVTLDEDGNYKATIKIDATIYELGKTKEEKEAACLYDKMILYFRTLDTPHPSHVLGKKMNFPLKKYSEGEIQKMKDITS